MITRIVYNLEDEDLLSMYFSNNTSIYSYYLFKHRIFDLLKIIKNEELEIERCVRIAIETNKMFS